MRKEHFALVKHVYTLTISHNSFAYEFAYILHIEILHFREGDQDFMENNNTNHPHSRGDIYKKIYKYYKYIAVL